jgi:hypothetical protein
MIILSILSIIVAISLQPVNNPLVSLAMRDPISPILFARLTPSPFFLTRFLSTLFLGLAIIGFHDVLYTATDKLSTLSFSELSRVAIPLQFFSKLFEAFFYLALCMYCIVYTTKRTNKILLLFYYLKSNCKQSGLLPRKFLYLRLSILLIFLSILTLVSQILIYVIELDNSLLPNLLSLLSIIRYLYLFFTFLIAI